jgi:hypothetical protein
MLTKHLTETDDKKTKQERHKQAKKQDKNPRE